MGRDAGWIALSSSLASRCVNICLIPECQFDLFGEKGLLAYVYERVKERGRLLMVVAEGAELAVRDFKLASAGTDPSGN